jgi:hypothetical protein
MKTILTAAALSLAATVAAAGPAVVTGVSPTAGAYEALVYQTGQISPIQWIATVAPAKAPARTSDVRPVAAPLATAGARADLAQVDADLTPVALR